MNRVLYGIIGLLFPFYLVAAEKAEKETSKNAVHIAVGGGFPIIDYKSADYNNHYAGLAGSGIAFSLSYQHFFIPNAGISLQWFGGSNTIDEEALSNDIKQKLPGATNWQIETSAWTYGALGPGIVLSFPYGPFNIICQSHLLFSSASFPASLLKDLTELEPELYPLERLASFAWGYDFSLALQYLMTDHLAFQLGANLFSANHSFSHGLILEPPIITDYNKTLRMQVLQIKTGLVLFF